MSIIMTACGVSSMFFHEYTTKEIFSFISQAGLDGIEYWLETPHFWLRGLPVEELAVIRHEHAEISTFFVHAPVLDLNPCSINPDVAEISITSTARAVSMAQSLGAGAITIHPGRRTAKRPPGDADFTRFDHYLSTIREAAMKDTVIVAIENMEPAINSLICTPERMRDVLDAEPWLRFTLDTSHALMASEEAVLQYIDLCEDRLSNVHLSLAENGKLHLPLNRKPVIGRILAALEDCKYQGPLILEIDDLNFGKPVSREEKCAIVARDRAFIRESLGEI